MEFIWLKLAGFRTVSPASQQAMRANRQPECFSRVVKVFPGDESELKDL
jgi:hypothetical protein